MLPARQESGARTAEVPPTFQALPGQVRTLLPDGRWLITGGEGANGPDDSAWLMDSSGIAAKLAKGLVHARAWHTATVLPDGSVLILGGSGAGAAIEGSSEIFAPDTLKFEPASDVNVTPRAHHTATLLIDGRVLIAGGAGEAGVSVEYLDSATKQKIGEGTTLDQTRQGHSATLFASGTVQLWGGSDSTGNALSFGESIDPALNFRRFEASAEDPSAIQPIRIETSVPAHNATDVSVDTGVAIRFSRSILMASLTPAAMTLSSADGVVPLRSVAAEGGMLAFARPVSALQQGTVYTLSIQGVLDSQGNSLPITSIVFITEGVAPENSKERLRNNDNQSAEHLPPLTAPPGITAISGRALMLNGHPLQGVTFLIDDKSAKTDGTGRFLLTGVSAGHHELIIDGRTVRASEAYGVFEVGVDVVDGKTTVLGYTVWMTALDTAHAVNLRFPTTTETVITNPLLPGLELHLPAGATITDIDGNVATQVSITPIPIDKPPFPLPVGVEVPIYFTVQPGGGYIHAYSGGQKKGARLIYPNSANNPPNTVYNFWNYDPEDRGWFVYGEGKVATDRKSIVPNPGVEIYEFTGAMVADTILAALKGLATLFSPTADPVDPATGLFAYEKTDLAVPDVLPIAVTRTYRQSDSRSRAFGIGTTHNYDIFLVGETSFWSYQELVLPNGARVRFDRISAGGSFALAVYQNLSSLGDFYGAKSSFNGNGWTLVRRDGTIFRFGDISNGHSALLSIQDRNGNIVTVDRNTSHKVSRVTSPNGRYIDFLYDTSNRIERLQDNTGRHVDYVYDTTGRLTQVTDANNGVWTYDYDASHQMTGIHDARNILYLQNHYDADGRVDLQTQADNGTYEFEYTTDTNGRVTQTDVTDPRGNVRRLTFGAGVPSANGFIAGGYTATDTFAYGTSLATTITTERQPGTNLPTSVMDSLGRTTTSTYDAVGNIISVTRLAGTPDAVTTTFTYEATFGNVTSITDPLGRTTTFTYDSHGNLATAVDPMGNRASWTYNTAGQALTSTDPNGNVTTFGYTAGNLTSVTDPLGRTVSFTYDNLGRPLTTSTLTGTTIQEYNPLNLVTRVTDALSGLTEFTYDPNGNLSTLKDARNNTTTYTYDNMDRLETRQDALLAIESFLYDGNGNITQATDRRGKLTTYTYDALDRASFVGFGMQPGPVYESSITYTYDEVSRLAGAVDSVTGTVSLDYDDLDRLISETSPRGVVSYTYDAAGRRISTAVSGQPAITYTYDDGDRLTQITQNGVSVSFTYDAGGRRRTLSLPDGIVTNYTYNAASDLTDISYVTGNATLGNLTYSYDAAGRRLSTGGTFAQVNLPLTLSSTTYNANNQLTQWKANTLTYDANGNLMSDGSKTYTWNARNQLATISGSISASFQYDAFGRRTSKTASGTTNNYLYDGNNVIQELSNTTPTANLLNGGVDEPLARSETSGTVYFLSDALGSPVALVDAQQAVQTTYTYDPYGATTNSGAISSNRAQFTGRENDDTGLYYMRARYYDPETQRFISEDPIGFLGGQADLYVYVGGNPVNFTDAFGLGPFSFSSAGGCFIKGALLGALGAGAVVGVVLVVASTG